jgi:hypothetical protein
VCQLELEKALRGNEDYTKKSKAVTRVITDTMEVFRVEESINIKIAFWKECECDDSFTFMASIAAPSSTGVGIVGEG